MQYYLSTESTIGDRCFYGGVWRPLSLLKLLCQRQMNMYWQFMRLVNLNITEKMSLTDISRTVGLTKEYTANLFKRETKKTVTEYINERKLIYAKELIIAQRMSLKEIAHHLGYDNYTYFSKLFKKYYGYSPKQLLTREISTPKL